MADTTETREESDGNGDFTSAMADIAERSQTLVQDFLTRQAEGVAGWAMAIR